MAARLVFIQDSFLKSIEEDILKLECASDNEKTEHKLKSYIKILESDFNDSKKYHGQILKLEGEDEEPIVQKYVKDGTMSKIRTHYHSYWADLNACLEAKAPSMLSSTVAPTCSSHLEKPKSYDLKLRRLEIPTFNGKYKEWTAFHNLFVSTVHKNKNLDPVQKLYYLFDAVTGEAKDHIKDLEPVDENYEIAMDLLKEQYDHKRKIAQIYVLMLLDFPPIKTENAREIKNLLSKIKECLASLKTLGLPVDEWDFILLCILQQKIPKTTYREWEKKLGASKEIPKFDLFKKFLEETFRMLEMVEAPSKDENKQKSFHIQTDSNKKTDSNRKTDSSRTTGNKGNRKKCILCKGEHGVARCQKFLSADLSKRLEIQQNNKLCKNCLGINHTSEKCYSFKSCIFCSKDQNKNARHHSLLHNHTSNPSETSSSNLSQPVSTTPINGEPSNNKNFHTINSGVNITTILATAQVRLVTESGCVITVRALIDPCSEDNYVTNNIVDLLKLSKYESPSSVSGIGDNSITNIRFRTVFGMQSIDGSFSTNIDAAVTKKISQLIPSEAIPTASCGFLNHMQLADPEYNLPGQVQLLLGTGAYAEIIQPGLKKFGTYIFCQKTTLGWIIGGKTESANDRPRPTMVFMTKTKRDDTLNEQLKRFWEIEELTNNIPTKPEDQLCEQSFLSSINQREDCHLSVDLPFRHSDQPIIGPSKEIALKRFLNLEKKLCSNETLRSEYHKCITEYIDSGHMIPTASEVTDDREYYLPHHCVIKEDSSTTKLRVVFDASCKASDGSSLNDHLMTGPKLQNDIRDIIFNWRKYEFAYTADIARMYRMFWVSDKHQKYQKILWRFDQSEPIKEYQLTTVTFGVNCAPYLAIRMLHYISEENQFKKEFTEACSGLKTEFYVDDYLSGGHSISEAVNKQVQLRKLLNMYGLNIRKWSSNNSQTLAGVPESHQDSMTDLSFEETEFKKTLGIYWTPKGDFFKFKIDEDCTNIESLTKRKALSLIARLYDPLGWIGPCTMFAKVLMQEIWKTKIGWDDEVCESIKNQFLIFFKELTMLEQIEIPRWTRIEDEQTPITLVGFCDASWKGYGAVIYMKNKTDNSNQTDGNLTMLSSKTKVAPIDFSSIPRLELCGALLLSELIEWASKLFLPRKVEVLAFTDSQVVLHWLRSHPSKWKPYVASRTTKILESVSSEKWYYVHTSKNPADFASKGILPSQITNNTLWWNGPSLLTVSESENSLTLHEEAALEQERKQEVKSFHTRTNSNDFLKNYSSHFKLCNVIRDCCRFVLTLIDKVTVRCPHLKKRLVNLKQKIQVPERLVLRLVQNEVFSSDIRNLMKNKPLDSKSRIASLSPFLDGFGILRMRGRLEHSDLSYNQKHPIILPSSHQITSNIIKEAHYAVLHGGDTLTLSYIRYKFHIIKASDSVKHFINKCIICIRHSKKQHEQMMGSLPRDRITTNRPFLNSGVDYAGPILTKNKGRGKTIFKSYIALFICLATKAIHLEVVSDLTSQAFLAAFRRFVNRRGYCQNLYSDNGTNMVGAKRKLDIEILKAETQWKSELNPDFQRMKTNWSFIPPAAPHFGGLWEAGVKSMKTHLVKTIGTKTLTFEELTTVLVQIEGILNSRPMCAMSSNVNSYVALTPAHFIIGEALVAPPEPILDSDVKAPVDRWLHLQTVRQKFWKSYVNDYLNRLQKRPKWLKTTTSFKENDLVLVQDDNLAPLVWPMAKVIETHPGSDGTVRVVTLKNSKGRVFKRPTVKLRLLPVNELTDV